MSATQERTRADLSREATALRAAGLTLPQIGARMGISRSYASDLITDPDRSKTLARRKTYGRVCAQEGCENVTDGSMGRKLAPVLCDVHFKSRFAHIHGTQTRYNSGCRCDDCRRSNRETGRARQTGVAPNHGKSGYVNYGCRCAVCSEAWKEYLRLHPEWHARWMAKVRGTEPPRHGYSVSYAAYGCRCDECKRWAREKSARYRASLKEKTAA